MAYASRSGRARVSERNPEAFSVCQRCGIWGNFSSMQWQHDWRGTALQNIRLLVCNSCLDRPQEQLRAIVVPADPLPVPFTIVEPFVYDETEGGGQPYGQPVGLQQYATSPLNGTTHYGVPLDILSITANGTPLVTMTCRTPHGLQTNGQIAIEGLTQKGATGFYSVIVTSATALQYLTFAPIPAGALLTPTTLAWTVNVGLPYGVTAIPQVGP